MARHNPYIKPRKKQSKPKQPGFEKTRERVLIFASLVKINLEISEFDIQRITGWGTRAYEDTKRIIKNDFPEFVGWDKKIKKFKFVKDFPDIMSDKKPIQMETSIKEKPELSKNELNVISAIKQESR